MDPRILGYCVNFAPQLYHVHNQQTDHQLFHASEDSLSAPLARLAAPDVEPSD